MIATYESGSPELAAALAVPETKSVWIHGSITYIYTGEDVPVDLVDVTT